MRRAAPAGICEMHIFEGDGRREAGFAQFEHINPPSPIGGEGWGEGANRCSRVETLTRPAQ